MTTFSSVIERMAEWRDFLVYDEINVLRQYRYIGQVRVTHILRSINFRENFYDFFDDIAHRNSWGIYNLRFYVSNDDKIDSTAYITFQDSKVHVYVIKALDDLYYDRKYLSAKPNGFTNIEFSYECDGREYKNQKEMVYDFNNRFYSRATHAQNERFFLTERELDEINLNIKQERLRDYENMLVKEESNLENEWDEWNDNDFANAGKNKRSLSSASIVSITEHKHARVDSEKKNEATTSTVSENTVDKHPVCTVATQTDVSIAKSLSKAEYCICGFEMTVKPEKDDTTVSTIKTE